MSETDLPMSSVSEISEASVSSSPSTYMLSQPPPAHSRPASALANAPNTPTATKRLSRVESDMYIKRGKKGSNNLYLMEEAVAAMKDLSKEETHQLDAYDHFAAYVAAQLRIMTPEQRAFCEVEIVKILSKKE